MRLLECNIEAFGVLRDCKLTFPDGFYEIIRENGAGKTTLTAFIKAMLYGLDDTRRTKVLENARKRYLPWKGDSCRGSLSILANGKKYRIERSFEKKASDDSFALYDIDTGLISSDYSEKIGEELFEIDADGFERTLFLSEENLSGKNENKTIAAKLSDLSGSDADLGSLDEALDLLDEERRFFRKKGGAGEIANISNKISENKQKLLTINRKKTEYRELLSEKNELSSELSKLDIQKKELETKKEAAVLEKIKAAHEKEYRTKHRRLEEKIKKYRELEGFFGVHIPTSAALDAIVYKDMDYKRTLASLSSQNESEASSLDSENINGLMELAISADNLKRNLDEKTLLVSEKKKSLNEIFPNGAPSEYELEKAECTVRNAKKRKWIFLSLGALMLIAGILLYFVNPLLAFTAVFALPFFVFGFVGAKKSASVLLEKYNILADKKSSYEAFLANLKESLSDYSDLTKEIRVLSEEIEPLERELLKSKATLDLFFIKNPVRTASERYLDKMNAYQTELLKKEGVLHAEKEAQRKAREHLATLKAEIDEFISLYPVTGEGALEKIKETFREYESLGSNITDESRELEVFLVENKIDKAKALSGNDEEILLDEPTTDLTASIKELTGKIARLDSSCRELAEEIELEDEIQAEIERLSEEERAASENLSIIELTRERLEKASESLSARYLEKTRTAFFSYLSMIDGEKGDADIDTTLSVKCREGAATKESDAYSKGTRDLYALAVRLALVDALYEKEKPFIILDDPFAYFDDAHLSRALELIKKLGNDRQIIYLSCTKSRA